MTANNKQGQKANPAEEFIYLWGKTSLLGKMNCDHYCFTDGKHSHRA